ncbi:MAG: hypothetical protein AVDCRST_MAG32-1833 [uncultured Nocardioides sp.]|uniref:Uncharacterized protein n=1 Tax=uncultured Nocardioides sp. TaxID=198441 RepID=A0A6J4NBQ8_9ACTN|nr:MAG: hypothetical protein AVDCRST_MAG32-1833 [uncultured Nocardioides sp.]
MSDRLTGGATDATRMSDRLTGPLTRALLVVLGFTAAGALAGLAWEALWEPPTGVVIEDEWLMAPSGPDVSFSGTALYVLLALPVGVVLGALAGLLRHHEVVTTGSVVLGSVVAGWVMYAVGHALGPPDPRVLAAGEPDYTQVPGDLVLAGPDETTSPYLSTAAVALPLGASGGLGFIYLSGFRQRQQG